MQFRNVLDEILGQRSKVAILRLLVRTRAELSGREVARSLSLDHKTCHAALRALAEQGVVEARRLGTAVAYRVRVDHPVTQDILIPAFEKEQGLVDRYVRDAIALSGVVAESVVLFGSVGMVEEEARSDVDLLLLIRDQKGQEKAEDALDTTAGTLAAKYGSVPQFIVRDVKTFKAEVLKGDPFFSEVLRTGRVIGGKPLNEVLKDGRKEDRHQKRSSG